MSPKEAYRERVIVVYGGIAGSDRRTSKGQAGGSSGVGGIYGLEVRLALKENLQRV